MLIKEVIEATNGTLLHGSLFDEVKSISQDTRTINEGDLYVALKGTRDGHDFINQIEDKAIAVLVSEDVDTSIRNVIKVDDTLIALGNLAKYVRNKAQAKVIAITGSVGKTSTKDMIYGVVSQKYMTLKTPGNYNNQIGLPLTILDYKDEEVMILEMGMNHQGEISYLSQIASPDIAVITNIGTAHIGELGSRENILKAKLEITDGLRDDGLLIVNGDNDMLENINVEGVTVKKVGIDCASDLKVKAICLNETDSSFTVNYDDKDYDVYVPVAGRHFVLNALIALEVGLVLNITMEECIKGIASFKLTRNRSDTLILGHHIHLIDSSYNANLDSMKSAIDVLSQYSSRKIAVLGDMLELGDYEEKIHREVGQYLIDKKIDVVICVGSISKYIYDTTKDVIVSYYFKNNTEAQNFLLSMLEENDTVMVKGSHSMGLKDIADFLKENVK